ncbi:Hypothetical protein FKW44_008861 [Caligus rogercresseyi]|uniref:Uncharacterized protein n=1 Tax=Caligus rogercresseyi TaxID=217165 RepID=A0A7T8QUJ7_CALRO|nr:Hypothetical protein FKW44_008861 [Caligus rogercresseyi]
MTCWTPQEGGREEWTSVRERERVLSCRPTSLSAAVFYPRRGIHLSSIHSS